MMGFAQIGTERFQRLSGVRITSLVNSLPANERVTSYVFRMVRLRTFDKKKRLMLSRAPALLLEQTK